MKTVPSLGPWLAFLFAAAPVSAAPAASPIMPAGAAVPWVTYDAADATFHGETLTSHDPTGIASESAGGSCVRLNAAGDSVTWTARAPANAIVVRYSIPDATAGGGAPGSVALFINGHFRRQLGLTSHFAWLYGNQENGQSNDPAGGRPHHFFDEVHAFITGAPVRGGDVVSLRKTATDPEPWCVVDLIDLENVPPPLARPAGSLSIADFGAMPDDGKDDTAAIEACIAEAAKEHKPVWFPTGTYEQARILVLDGVAVEGAGPWYTRLTAPALPTKEMGFKGNCGFYLQGTGSAVRDLMIEGSQITRTGPPQHGLGGHPSHFVVENVWVEHTGTGGWLGPCDHGVIRGCRFRDTFADGLNINNASHDVLIEQNHSRNTGDDGLALFSSSTKGGLAGPCVDVDFRHNTVEAPWWANCLGLYGGRGIVAEDNLLRGGNRISGIAVTTGFGVWPGEGTQVRGNVLIGCGGSSWKQSWGAILVYTPGAPITGLAVTDNQIVHPTLDAVELMGLGKPGSRIEVELADNEIIQPGRAFLDIRAKAAGWAKLRGNLITGLKPDQKAIVSQAPTASFQVIQDSASP